MICIAALSVFYVEFNVLIKGRFSLTTYFSISGLIFCHRLCFYNKSTSYCRRSWIVIGIWFNVYISSEDVSQYQIVFIISEVVKNKSMVLQVLFNFHVFVPFSIISLIFCFKVISISWLAVVYLINLALSTYA